MKLLKLLGANIRQYRKISGLTQAQLAERVELSVEMVGKMERGVASPSLDTIGNLSLALDVSPAALFGSSVDVSGSGARSDLLREIGCHLAQMNLDELEKAEKVLVALRD